MSKEVQIEYVKTAELKPYAKNAKLHPPKQIKQIAQSIKEYGFLVPILLTTGDEIVAGHGRILAAQQLGIDTVPAIRATDLTPTQIQAYRLLDNKIVSQEWDNDILKDELTQLKDLDVNLLDLGFKQAELDRLLKGKLDEIPQVEIKEETVSKVGDLWEMGEHRLIVGDSTDKTHVEKLFNGKKPFVMVTDPPYGVNYDANAKGGDGSKINVLNDDRADLEDTYRLSQADVIYIWHSGLHSDVVAQNIEAAGYELRSQIIWVKDLCFDKSQYHWKHEPCFYAVKSGANAKFVGDAKQVTVWELPPDQMEIFSTIWRIPARQSHAANEDMQTDHATQKPIECMARPIRNHGDVGDIIYDPFLGSGTTLIACEQLQRVCYGMELNPQCADIIVNMWEKFTGRKAQLVRG